ncbi:MAG: chemotaxis protein CheD [Thermaerobacter sp.]|nr:chemotaxis protein CheD [Thermaerobacter sp.]
MVKRTPVGLGELCISADPHERLCIFGLGSCIAVYLYAPGTSATALAHVVLPESQGRPGEPGRYADTAVPALVAGLRSLGHEPHRLRAAIAGGAAVLGFTSEIGQQNIRAVRRYLEDFGIPVVQDDTGGIRGRSVEFDPQGQHIEVRVLAAPQVSI